MDEADVGGELVNMRVGGGSSEAEEVGQNKVGVVGVESVVPSEIPKY